MEKWRHVTFKGYEHYAVSDLGVVKNANTSAPLSGWLDKDGYKVVELWSNGKRKRIPLHRLVALTFIENQFNKPQVNHINGNKVDNSVVNLEWVTNGENQAHAIRTGLTRTKLDFAKANEIREKFSMKNVTQRELADEYSVSRRTIQDVIYHRAWKVPG